MQCITQDGFRNNESASTSLTSVAQAEADMEILKSFVADCTTSSLYRFDKRELGPGSDPGMWEKNSELKNIHNSYLWVFFLSRIKTDWIEIGSGDTTKIEL